MAEAWTVRVGPHESGLAIESPSERPQHARDGSRETVFDGILFNRQELSERPELEGLRWHNDAGLLLHLYARLGPSLLSELRGVFALVVWDARDGALVATRDPLGMHPLFYARADAGIVLSWSIDALLRTGVSREVNRVFVAEHLLHRWRALDETYFSAIRRVPAGHYLVGNGEVRRYWRAPPDLSTELPDLESWLDAVEERLEQAVDRCLDLGRAGIYLSGGVDSTTVAMAAARVSTRRELQSPLALCVRFPDESSNETDAQGRVLRALSLPVLTCSAESTYSDPAALVENSLAAIAQRGAPVGAMWDHAYDLLAGEARSHGCDVLLDGEGGDEWLTAPAVHAADLLRAREWRHLGSFLNAATQNVVRHRRRAIAAAVWSSAARPLLHRAVTMRLASLAPTLHASYRRRRHALPDWISRDQRLRQTLGERLDAPPDGSVRLFSEQARESTIWHPLVSMHLEDSFSTGRRIGIPLLRPLWDVDLVRLLYAAPRGLLELGGRQKGLAVALIERRISLGQDWPLRATADAFLGRVLAGGLVPAWHSIGGPKALESNGILEPGETWAMVQKNGSGETLPLRELLGIVKSELWLRRRLED